MIKHNLKFLKSLLYSDFLLLDKKGNNYDNSKILLTKFKLKQNSLSVLDPLDSLKGIKQFIRLLQYIKLNKNCNLQINSKNQQVFDIFESFFSKEYETFLLFFLNTPSAGDQKSKLILLIDTFFLSNDYAIKNLYSNNFNLVVKVSPLKKASIDWYSYKIYNELDNTKKIVYFFILIRQILFLNK